MHSSFAVTYITALVATFGLLAIFAWLLKRLGQPWITQNPMRRMKVLEKLPLTPNTTAYLIQIDNSTLFAITTPQSSLVHSWDVETSPPTLSSNGKKRKSQRT